MTARLRLLALLARPPLVLLLGMFAMAGVAQGGAAGDEWLAARAVATVTAFLLFCVVVNDLSDVAVDRLNVPDRPLASGLATRADFVAIGAVGGVLALAGAALTGGVASAAVMAAGLAMSAAYSLRPTRLADRGAVASLVVPFGYVAVPFLTGLLATRPTVTAQDLGLLAGLYAGFVGRILLKDFRDVRGDALLGKRTFLVRHGRSATCGLSGGCWLIGLATLAAVRERTPEIGAAYVLYVAAALVLLRALANAAMPRRDELLVSALAICGRGVVASLVLHLAATDAGWPRLPYAAALATLAAVTLGQARVMVRSGPRARTTIPRAWETPAVATHQ